MRYQYKKYTIFIFLLLILFSVSSCNMEDQVNFKYMNTKSESTMSNPYETAYLLDNNFYYTLEDASINFGIRVLNMKTNMPQNFIFTFAASQIRAINEDQIFFLVGDRFKDGFSLYMFDTKQNRVRKIWNNPVNQFLLTDKGIISYEWHGDNLVLVMIDSNFKSSKVILNSNKLYNFCADDTGIYYLDEDSIGKISWGTYHHETILGNLLQDNQMPSYIYGLWNKQIVFSCDYLGGDKDIIKILLYDPETKNLKTILASENIDPNSVKINGNNLLYLSGMGDKKTSIILMDLETEKQKNIYKNEKGIRSVFINNNYCVALLTDNEIVKILL